MPFQGAGCASCKARFVKFRLSEKLTCDDHRQQAVVEEFWDGEHPSPGSEPFYVYNLSCEHAYWEPVKWAFHGDAGWAGLAVLDDQNTSEGPEEESGFYRIIELGPCCSWPATEIDVAIQAALKSTDSSASGEFQSIRSPTPFDGTPEGLDGSNMVEFRNLYGLDASCDSIVTLQRKLRSDGSNEWVMVAARSRKARYVLFHFDPEESSVSVSDFWEGENPTPCGPLTVQYPLGAPCEASDIIASYDPRTDAYIAMDTQASMLGTPHVMNVMQSATFDSYDPCTLNYVTQTAKGFPCESSPSFIQLTPNLTLVEVVNDISFYPADPECTGYCRYEWVSDGNGSHQWQQTGFCEHAPDCECVLESGDLDPPEYGESHIREFPCGNAHEYDPQQGSIDISTMRLLVCYSVPGTSGFSIPVIACKPGDSEDTNS